MNKNHYIGLLTVALVAWEPSALAYSGYDVLRGFGGWWWNCGGDGEETPGTYPNSLIEGSDGFFYGTTTRGGSNDLGTVFRIDKSGCSYAVLHHFGAELGDDADGIYPSAGLLEGSDGNLYGTTYEGGTNGDGTIFRIKKDGSDYQILHTFTRWDGSTQTAWEGYPNSALTEGRDGMVYGTTSYYGPTRGWCIVCLPENNGAVFKLNKNGSGYAVLHQFTSSDGSGPRGIIQGNDGVLYGVTDGLRYHGGVGGPPGQTNPPPDYGTVFKLNPDGTGFASIHVFQDVDGEGRTPQVTVVEGSDGVLYGTTAYGGITNDGRGTVFKLNKDGTLYSVLHMFDWRDNNGSFPATALVEGKDGAFYGTTAVAAQCACYDGTVFRIDKDGTGFMRLVTFQGTVANDGSGPNQPVQASDGIFYGTTRGGGPANGGTFFRLLPPGYVSITVPGAITVAGPEGWRFRIDFATTLSSSNQWQTLTNITLSAESASAVDETFPLPPQRFYRAVHLP